MQHATRLRATRASPPNLAGHDDKRRTTYTAALQQFDELMQAAAVTSAVTRPLPLYYAVHQAGKAIAAAWAEGEWSHIGHGHGLGQEKGVASGWQSDVLQFRVQPRGRGIFGAVARTLGAATLTGGVPIGALWAALPEVNAPPGDKWPLALPVEPQWVENQAGAPFATNPFGGNVYFRGKPALDDAVAVNDLLSMYPAAAGAVAHTHQGELVRVPTDWGLGVGVAWPPPPDWQSRYGEPTPSAVVEAYVMNRVPRYRRDGGNWLIPKVGDGKGLLPPILLWWVLLFGLSLLARYEPAAWRAALDLDASAIADPLTELLDQALVIVPDLLFEAATRNRGA
jgi:hypothetical protein